MADRNGSLDGLYGLDISVSVHTCPDEIRVALAGELDLATAERLDRALQDVLERRPARLVVDLSSLEFMDASGIGALVGADRLLSAAEFDDGGAVVGEHGGVGYERRSNSLGLGLRAGWHRRERVREAPGCVAR